MNFVIVGLGQLGKCMLDSLSKRNLSVMVIDQDEDKVQAARDLATTTIKTDATNFAVLQEVFPENVSAAIVDLGRHQLERSILAANYLHKLKCPEIVVHAVNPSHAEILQIVGATRVVFPEEEAAERLVGILTGGMEDYFPVSEEFSLVEMPLPKGWIGRTLQQLQLRQTAGVNVVAFRPGATGTRERWAFPDPDRAFEKSDYILLAGNNKNLRAVKA